MKTIHHFSVSSSQTKELFDTLLKLNIKGQLSDFPQKKAQLFSFDIAETDPEWSYVFELMKKYQGFDIYNADIYDTFFEEEEIRKAKWLRIIPGFYQGYAQPEGNWPFKQKSLEDVCSLCARYRQTNRMRLKKEPTMKKKAFLTPINTGFIFAIPEVFLRLEELGAKGYEKRPILKHSTGDAINNVSQLFVPASQSVRLAAMENHKKMICPICGRFKYHYHGKGVMQIVENDVSDKSDFLITEEWFGTGLIAYPEIVVSNRIANLILDQLWEGIRLKVAEAA